MRNTVLAFVAASLIVSSALALDGGPAYAHFRILQMNDVYKIEGLEKGAAGGIARLRTLRQHLESDGTPVLVLHGGDALFPSVMSKKFKAQAMIDALNRLDGKAGASDPHLFVTFGNHEFDDTEEVLLARIAESEFRWLATNAYRCSNGNCSQPYSSASPNVAQTALVEADGVKVGLFGVLYEMTEDYAKTTPVIPAATAAVQSLRDAGARVIIAVTHQEMDDDRKLVAAVPGIDLVIGGHDHLFQQRKACGTWISKADADAKSVIVYDVIVPRTGPLTTLPMRIAVDSTIPEDPAVKAVVDQWVEKLAGAIEDGKGVVGTTKNLLEGVEPAIRGKETALGNLLADVIREKMKTKVAFLNGGGVRINDNIPPGDITNADLAGVFYYPNNLVAMTLTGSQLLEILNNSVSQVNKGAGRFLQVSNIRFTYARTGDTYTVAAADVTVDGKPLDLDASYTASTVEYLYEKGYKDDDYQMFGGTSPQPKELKVYDVRPDFQASFLEYLKARDNVVSTSIEDRIVPQESARPVPAPLGEAACP